MYQLLIIFHVLIAICLLALILIQHGKGADAGAAFGSGASNTMFGARGSIPFLVKLTALLAAVFFCTCLILGYMTSQRVKQANTVQLPIKTHTHKTS